MLCFFTILCSAYMLIISFLFTLAVSTVHFYSGNFWFSRSLWVHVLYTFLSPLPHSPFLGYGNCVWIMDSLSRNQFCAARCLCAPETLFCQNKCENQRNPFVQYLSCGKADEWRDSGWRVGANWQQNKCEYENMWTSFQRFSFCLCFVVNSLCK